jgi:hypothetical protein
LGNLRVYKGIILKYALKEQGVRMWTGFFWLKTVSYQAFMNVTINLLAPRVD